MAHLKLSLQALSWPTAWPNVERKRAAATGATAEALMDLCATDAAVAAEVAAAGFDAAELRRLSRLRPPRIWFRKTSIRQFFTWLRGWVVLLVLLARVALTYLLCYFGLWEHQGRILPPRRRR